MTAPNWRDRAPAMLRETFTGPNGEPCFTTVDRRWLWRLESALVVSAPANGTLAELQSDLHQYLIESCEHHWSDYAGDEHIPAHRQCVWCNRVEWAGEAA